MMEAIDIAGGVLGLTAIYAWFIWLHSEIQATTYAYRQRVTVKQRRCP